MKILNVVNYLYNKLNEKKIRWIKENPNHFDRFIKQKSGFRPSSLKLHWKNIRI